MTRRDRRQKASDVFRESEPLFGKVSFDEAFLQIEDVRVEVREYGRGVRMEGRTSVYGKQRLGQYIDCHNPLCYNGGFSIGTILYDMVRKGEIERETTEACQGYEGSPKGRRKYRDCYNSFEIKVSLKYKDGKSEEAT